MNQPATVPSTQRRRVMLPLVLVVVCAVLGTVLVLAGANRYQPPPQPSAAQGWSQPGTSPGIPGAMTATPAPTVNPLPPATPTRVKIPAIKVDAPLIGLNLGPDRQLAAPPDNRPTVAGWYQHGVSPGSVGTAVIAGHVDTHAGPAVFYNLGALRKGFTIDVERADHTTAVFTIDAVQAFPATGFPSQLVYGPSSRPELRLITCGAGFDKKRQTYLGNVVVFAHLTAVRTHT